MPRPDETHLEAAWRLLAHSGANAGTAHDRAEAVGRIYEALFQSLARILGASGMRALCERSLKLTKAQFPHLLDARSVETAANSNQQLAQDLVMWLRKLDPILASEIAATFYAHLLRLLTTLIGDRLVAQLMKRAFPAFDVTGEENS